MLDFLIKSFLLLVEPDSLFKIDLLLTHHLVGDESALLSLLFGIFHFKSLFLVLEPIFYHETVSLHAFILEDIAVVS